MLKTNKDPETGKLARDVYFWLGLESTQVPLASHPPCPPPIPHTPHRAPCLHVPIKAPLPNPKPHHPPPAA